MVTLPSTVRAFPQLSFISWAGSFHLCCLWRLTDWGVCNPTWTETFSLMLPVCPENVGVITDWLVAQRWLGMQRTPYFDIFPSSSYVSRALWGAGQFVRGQEVVAYWMPPLSVLLRFCTAASVAQVHTHSKVTTPWPWLTCHPPIMTPSYLWQMWGTPSRSSTIHQQTWGICWLWKRVRMSTSTRSYGQEEVIV